MSTEFDKMGLEDLAAMRMGVSYYDTIKIRKYALRIRCLSVSEKQKIMNDVRATLLRGSEEEQSKVNQELEIAKQTIMLASTSDIDKSDYKITDFVLGAMTIDEVLYLWKQYTDFEERVSPEAEQLPIEAVNKLIEDLKKKQIQLNDLSWTECRSIARSFLTREDTQTDS